MSATEGVLEAIKVALRLPGTDLGYVEWARMVRAVMDAALDVLARRVRYDDGGHIHCRDCGVEITARHRDICPMRKLWEAMDDAGMGRLVRPKEVE
jgi:hypothetical protein